MTSDAVAYFSKVQPTAVGSHEPSRMVNAATLGTAPPAQAIEIEVVEVSKSDEELLLQVRDGSREALAVLFRRHARTVYKVSNRILQNEAEAEDLVQELFLFVFQKADLFDGGKSSAISWLIQMTYHRAIDRRRYLASRCHYDAQPLQEERIRTNAGQISLDGVDGRALLIRLREDLPLEQQQTLELHFLEGYTFHEIAEKTGQTFGKVRHHYYRGMESLRSYVFSGKTPSK
jgi:RNA polymerase sigma-70 factor (ECF subfamily)